MANPIIDIIIPAYNEEKAIGHVVNDIPKELIREIIVVNNASGDRTRQIAEDAGATVLDECNKGYGFACLKGMDFIRSIEQKPDIVLFMDGDHSDHASEIQLLINSIVINGNDLVIGNRVAEKRMKGSMTPQQVFGNWLATFLIRKIYSFNYKDLGPFRAIRWTSLEELGMEDKTYGWTVEMQIKAIHKGLKIGQVDVSYRKRKGVSKVSGTVKGTIMAGYKIIGTIWKYRKKWN